MELKEIQNKEIWESFLLRCQEKTFLQSWNWGEFQKEQGNKIWRFGIFENNGLVSVALVVRVSAKRGSFLLVPHGPVARMPNYKILEILLGELKKIAKKEKASFIRISPIWERTAENSKVFRDLEFVEAPLHMHPESSWKLDITKSENELLAGMRKTTRYLVKQAQKDKDIEIFQSKNINDIDIFNKIHLEVVRAQKFVPFSLDYFRKEFKVFAETDKIAIFFARYKDTIIAGSYEIFWSNAAFYHHAALLPKYKKIPVSYLLQWEAIKEAKRRGCKVYDFWGYADPAKNPKHPYAGPTLFKMGFGGYLQEYVRTQDFILSKKYWINYIIELARKVKRGL